MSSAFDTGYEQLGATLAQAVDEACDQFEEAWGNGERPAIIAYLEHVSAPARAVLVRELVLFDIASRRRTGDEPRPQDYLDHYPMLDEAWLAQALALPTAAAPAPYPGQPRTAPPAMSIAGYEIEEELGRGGMGVVYRARQVKLNRFVALKMILATPFARPDELARFRGEAEILARLQHPNIVQIYEVDERQGHPYFVLEYVNGGNLAQRLGGVPLSGQSAAQLLEPLARAIHAAHQFGIVHCDLKPANILLHVQEEKGDGASHDLKTSCLLRAAVCVPKVSDFGLARQLEGEAGVTRTGAVLGTPSYMAPEQAAGQRDEISPATDVYALGAVLYEILSGRPPFLGATPMETLDQVRHQDPVSLQRLQPTVPRDLETICLKCLQKDAQKRYTTALALANDLRRFQNGEPILARPVGRPEKLWRWARRHPITCALAAAVFTLALVILIGSEMNALKMRRQRDEALNLLYESKLSMARFHRARGQAGSRFASLDLLAQAAQLPGNPKVLRDEVIASLSLSDLRVLRTWEMRHVANASAAFDSNLKRYAVDSGKGEIRILDVAAQNELGRLAHPNAGVIFTALFFSSDDQFLAAHVKLPENRFELVVWDWRRRERLLQVPNNEALAGNPFSPAGNQVAVVSTDRVALYELPSGALQRSLETMSGVLGIAFEADTGRLALALRGAGVVQIKDVASNSVLGELPHPAPVLAMAWRGADEQLAVACSDRHIYVWDVVRRQQLSQLKGHDDVIERISYSRSGNLLLSSSRDSVVRLWDPWLIKQVLHTRGQGLAFSSDGRRLAFRDGSALGILEIAHADACRLLHPAARAGQENEASLSLDIELRGRALVAAGDYGVRLWDLISGRQVAHLELEPTSKVLFHPRGTALLTYGAAGLRLWPIAEDASRAGVVWRLGPAQALAAITAPIFADASWSDAGERLAVTQANGRALILDLDDKVRQREFGERGAITSLALSRDGRWLAAYAGANEGIQIWDAVQGKLLQTLSGSRAGDRICLCFSGDGQWLGAGFDNEFRFWKCGDWEKSGCLVRGKEEKGTRALAFSERGLAVVAHTLRELRLIKPGRLPELLATLAAPDPPPIRQVCLSADERLLAAATDGAALCLWDLGFMRQQLAELKLDWSPPLADSAAAPQPLLRVVVEK